VPSRQQLSLPVPSRQQLSLPVPSWREPSSPVRKLAQLGDQAFRVVNQGLTELRVSNLVALAVLVEIHNFGRQANLVDCKPGDVRRHGDIPLGQYVENVGNGNQQ
jgi:hypothetical protein